MPSPFERRYAPWQRRLHWTVFALVALAYTFVELHDLAPRGSALRSNLLQAHFLAGLTVLALFLPRLLQRLRHGKPAIVPAPSRWMDRLSRATQLALYVFLLAQPVLGLLTVWVGGHALGIVFTGWQVPSPFVGNHEWHERLEDVHVFLGNAFYYVIGLHIVAALFHHFVRGDDTLKRML
jgi:cytochrome b561